MKKKILLLLMVVICGACNKNNHQKPACTITGACTALFTSVNVFYLDQAGNKITLKKLVVTNLRTHQVIDNKPFITPGFPPAAYTIATDSNIKDFSTEGDDTEVSATDSATSNVKTTLFKIGGDCTCHIHKISGPDTVKFN
ncbi:hypothetical protein [Mucilaginibacter sp. SP1R1]|uniref:hypothetical protein n=1 Tax=Mucilaginibacter sp. SP1R1 TaxID=2723091 RepID=UPI001613642D|nr:hypothetical protein [Mucilaginibacter sp. SP1R1]MBB6151019.1 hypothetical protein [Mucilaginibacter sp. SP1R1]